jgi:hypothetical protein
VKSEAVCSPEHQNIQPLCTWCKTQRKIINWTTIFLHSWRSSIEVLELFLSYV